MSRLIVRLMGILLFVQLSACGGSSGDGESIPDNAAPAANAGGAQVVSEQTQVTLSGAGTDADGSIVSYLWTQTAGVPVELDDADNATASFTAPVVLVPQGAQELTFTLTVTDNEGRQASDTITVTVNPVNTTPTASAEDALVVIEQTETTLAGTGDDTDGEVAFYLWRQTAGIPVMLNGANTATASFTAPTVLIEQGPQGLTFVLTVTDNEGGQMSDSVNVTVNPFNTLPSIDAGSPQMVDEQTEVVLLASGDDIDGSIISYLWTQTAGVTVELSGTNTDSASFTAPVVLVSQGSQELTFLVTVIDNEDGLASDTVTITVNPVNVEPSVNAGSQQTVNEQTLVTLSASASDIDGSIESYSWSQQAQGTLVTLSDTTIASPTFTSPELIEQQTLIFEVTVTDNDGVSVSDTVEIVVNPVNIDPTVDAGADQSVVEDSEVTLNATADDSDGSIDSVLWTQTAGTSVTLINDDSLIATFTAPMVSEAEKLTLTFEVTVTDNEGASISDTIDIKITDTLVVPSGKINDTGITTCSNASTNDLFCPVNGFEGQDAEYGRDVSHNDNLDGKAGLSFTKIDANGDPLADAAVTWFCVKDNVTGLIWEVKTDDGGLQDKDNRYSWYNPDASTNGESDGTQDGGVCSGSDCDTLAYVNTLNAQGLCGANDWRMPMPEELRGIVDYGSSDPAIETGYFPNVQNSYYWSRSPSVSSSTDACALSFEHGAILCYAKNLNGYVRLVREQ